MTKNKKKPIQKPIKVGGVTLEEWCTQRADPSHLQHERWKIVTQKMSELASTILPISEAIKEARQTADILYYLAEHSTLEEFINIFPDQGMGLIILCLTAKNNEAVQAKMEAEKEKLKSTAGLSKGPKAAAETRMKTAEEKHEAIKIIIDDLYRTGEGFKKNREQVTRYLIDKGFDYGYSHDYLLNKVKKFVIPIKEKYSTGQ